MNKIKIFLGLFIFCLLGLVDPLQLYASMSSPSGYQIWADVISEGGLDHTSSTNYQLRETIGEGITGQSSSTNYNSNAGFRSMEKDFNIQTLTLSISSGGVLNLGTLSRSNSNIGSHTLTLETNSATGVQVSFSGNTLSGTSGSVDAIGSTAATAAAGTNQFGFNVIYDSGDATAQSQSPYNNASQYAFHGGDTIISAAGPMVTSATFNVSYLANVSNTQPAGDYSTAVTYTATANF